MKILLLSDTHGDLDRVYRIYEKLTDIDMIFHCGDYQRDALQLEDTLGIPVLSVKGNCDGCTKPDRKIAETPAGRILLTHGHLEGVGFDETKLLYLAEESDCIAVCCGHTHRALYEDFNGIFLINPGSLTEPRDGSGGTYAILHCEEDQFYGNIVHYDRIFPDRGSSGSGNKKTKKPSGGFLRNLLNYSDRF